MAAALATPRRIEGVWGGGWRLNGPPVRRLRHGTEERSVPMDAPPVTGGPAVVATTGTTYVDVEGQSLEFVIAPTPSIEDAVRHAGAAGEGASVLTAPMPGRVIAVRAAAGDRVSAHQPLVVLEAMKMEHAVVAPMDGSVARIDVSVGEQVQRGDVLVELSAS